MYHRTWVALSLMFTLLLSLFLVLLIAVSEAAPPKPPPAVRTEATPAANTCASQGQLAATIARARDGGVALSALLDMDAGADVSAATLQWITTLTINIYAAETTTPTQIRNAVEVQCYTALQKAHH